jgi:hypothetical protein
LIEIEVGDYPAVAIRIVDFFDAMAWIPDVQAIVGYGGHVAERGLVDAGWMRARHRHRGGAVVDDADRFRRRETGADRHAAVFDVRAEHGERIGVLGGGDGVESGFHSAVRRPAPVSASAVIRSQGA